jgi:hypothetical protein
LQNIYIYIVKRLFILLDKKNFFEKAIVWTFYCFRKYT